ncbi:B3 domain-containing protein REM5-like isoform X2 [Tasmannia lanceolata]|uniref:B3 domain-containing protein REM5-like isoform X2 n=1 Tax=Tasmannia lanceolata TaxID=3420 RepID=UPI004063B0DA
MEKKKENKKRSRKSSGEMVSKKKKQLSDEELTPNWEMKENYSHHPQFLKPIFPESFQKISIPIAFHKFLVGEKSDIAVLNSRRGKSWRVKVKGGIDGVFFEDGWGDFVADHGLCSGEILVFRYQGNMVFDVTVFDKTACEKSYEKKMEKQRERKDEKHVGASKETKAGPTISEPKVYTRGSREVVLPTAMPSSPTDLLPQSDDSPSVLHSGGQKVGFEGSSCYKPKAPHFLSTIKSVNLTRCYMGIPEEFAGPHRESFQYMKQIILKDPEGRSFPVTISNRRKPSGFVSTFLCGGWRRFAIINKLEVGDACIFELTAEDVMEIRIFRR